MPSEEVEMWGCNDCGKPCPKFDELCHACYEDMIAREEWEELHPEARCPPRE
jgi:NMD protein affecting ribosome stability and mRNA decay